MIAISAVPSTSMEPIPSSHTFHSPSGIYQFADAPKVKLKTILQQLEQMMSAFDDSFSSDLNLIFNCDGDNDVYCGLLWKIFLKMKFCGYKDPTCTILRDKMYVYRNWFDLKIGKWIQEIGCRLKFQYIPMFRPPNEVAAN